MSTTYEDNKKLTVINLYAGPGAGKSTLASAVFSEMKRHNFNVEFVHEFAKDCVWEQHAQIFTEQDYIFAHQHRMIRRLVDHDVDFAIVDSSIVLGLLYMPSWYPTSFTQFVLDVYHTYDNINIVLQRNPDFGYDATGRNQTVDEALVIDQQIVQLLASHGLPYHSVVNDQTAVSQIIEIVDGHCGGTK